VKSENIFAPLDSSLTAAVSGSKDTTQPLEEGLLTGCRTRVDKVNAELVTLTYGTIVSQLCADYQYDYTQVNQQLDKMGYNIGMRLIEDFLSKTSIPRCGNFRETADMISKVSLQFIRKDLSLISV
jgi:hypothetical protein